MSLLPTRSTALLSGEPDGVKVTYLYRIQPPCVSSGPQGRPSSFPVRPRSRTGNRTPTYYRPRPLGYWGPTGHWKTHTPTTTSFSPPESEDCPDVKETESLTQVTPGEAPVGTKGSSRPPECQDIPPPVEVLRPPRPPEDQDFPFPDGGPVPAPEV